MVMYKARNIRNIQIKCSRTKNAIFCLTFSIGFHSNGNDKRWRQTPNWREIGRGGIGEDRDRQIYSHRSGARRANRQREKKVVRFEMYSMTAMTSIYLHFWKPLEATHFFSSSSVLFSLLYFLLLLHMQYCWMASWIHQFLAVNTSHLVRSDFSRLSIWNSD